MVKSTKTEEISTVNKRPKIKKAVSLVKKEDLLAKFGKLDGKIAELEAISTQLVVRDHPSLTIAENHVKTVQGMITDVETVRKTFKDPYFQTGKAIDAYAKTLSDPLERIKLRINKQVSSFKDLLAAQERNRIESEKKEREEKELAKNAEIEKIDRLTKMMYARIYGGAYYVKDGSRKTNSGCQTPEDCDELQTSISQNFPSSQDFVYMKAEIIDIKTEGLKLLMKHKSNLIDINSNDPKTREDALRRINEAKIHAEVLTEDEIEHLKRRVEKESATIEREDRKALKEAGKGMREFLKFTVEDEFIVPPDFKVVDDKLVNEYLRINSERIKSMLKEHRQPIPGIVFYVETKFVTSG